jgi:hypothetical protein
MLEAEVSRQILIDFEQHPDSSPHLVFNLRPEVYGVSGSTLREQARQRWYYLLNLRENRPAAYRQILKNQQRLVETTRLSQQGAEAQSPKSEEKVWWEKEAKSRNTSWSAHRSPKIDQDNDSDSEGEDSEELESEEEEDSKKRNTRKNMSFNSPPTTRSRAKRGSTPMMAPSPSPYRAAPSSSYRDMDEASLDGKQICFLFYFHDSSL